MSKESNWIPVSERLPEEDQEVIICIGECSVGTAIYTYFDNGSTFRNENYEFFQHDEVTHWQPLPKPPQS